MSNTELFTTIFGRNLIAELPNVVHRPYLVVTMADLWDKFSQHFDDNLAQPYFVSSIDLEDLEKDRDKLPPCNCVIGLGGGQALDTAKYFAWALRLPLFQVPTALSVNAVFGHRSGLRVDGHVRYMGWAVPQAVYIDFDVILTAPALLNRSGVCEVMCYHTAHLDWKFAHEQGKCEAKWPYDERLVAEAQEVLASVMGQLDAIHDVTEDGIRTLALANRWGGAAFHNAGWNPRHIEGTDHFVFYALEYYTGKKFLHGQPVCLGIYVGSLLHNNKADQMLEAIYRAGVDIRPEAMDISWDDVAHALHHLRDFVQQAGLWYSIAHEAKIDDAFIEQVHTGVTEKFGAWDGHVLS